MSSVEIDHKTYEMPPREGMSIAQFLIVADIERSARYYERVFGGHIQIANTWLIVKAGDGPPQTSPRLPSASRNACLSYSPPTMLLMEL